MKTYSRLLSAGNKAQIEKLEANNHKRGMYSMSVFHTYERLEQEMKELHCELFHKNGTPKKPEEINFPATRMEFADIGNFSHMGIGGCDKVIDNGC